VTTVQRGENKAIKLTEIAHHLAAARAEQGWSQADLAARARLKRQQINYFETGARTPSLGQLLQIARALDLPLQRFLSGGDRPGGGVRDIAIELRSLGLIDLWVEAPVVPGAFRRPEEVIARAVAGKEPEARIVEGVPAVLAWNRWNGMAAPRSTAWRGWPTSPWRWSGWAAFPAGVRERKIWRSS
jgi:putative transcriptional regulator